MSCLLPAAKRVWRGIRVRLGLRRTTGLGRLQKEVRTCEYSDVHVMWEMLSKPTSGVRDDRRRHTTAGGKSASTRRARKAGWRPTAARSNVVSLVLAQNRGFRQRSGPVLGDGGSCGGSG